MEIVNEVSFEEVWQYLKKIISPEIDYQYPNPVPAVNAPDYKAVVFYYKKHFPNRNAPTLAAIDEGYEWIWNEFKSKVEAKELALNKADSSNFRKKVYNFFAQLQEDKNAYQLQLEPLQEYGNKLFLSLYEPKDQPYYSYFGTLPQRQALALENSIRIIEEGLVIYNDETAPNTTTASQATSTFNQKNLVCNSFAEMFFTDEDLNRAIEIFHTVTGKRRLSVIDTSNKWLGKERDGSRSVLLAWIEVLELMGWFKVIVPNNRKAELLNKHFVGLNLITKDDSLWRKQKDSTIANSYHADFLQLIKKK